MLGVCLCVVRSDVELLWQVPFAHRHLMQILENGAALHFGPMAAIVEYCAHMVYHLPRPKPHRSNQARDQSLILILEHPCGQLAPYRGAHCLLLVHLVDQHEPLRAATVRTLLFQASVGQTLRSLKLIVVP